jgi:uncharacterized protein YbjQ (UPF0145 family)
MTKRIRHKDYQHFFNQENIMLLASIDQIPNKEFEVLGLVQGNTVQAKDIGKDIMAGLRNLMGGEVSEYTDMLKEARQMATDRMIDEAVKLGADAVLGVRFASADIVNGAAEVIAYGTAVKMK